MLTKHLSYTRKKLIIFDIDDTLAVSKTPLDEEMACLIGRLSKNKNIAIISGAFLKQFEKQIIAPISKLARDAYVPGRIYLFPTCGAAFYAYKDGVWQEVYAHTLSPEEKKQVFDAFESALRSVRFQRPAKLFGELIEDRDTQVTFSAFGQDAPIEKKRAWDPHHRKREKIIEALAPTLPEYDIRIGGTTSIDVTKKGIDKAHGVREMKKYFSLPFRNMLFVGDKLSPGGNDYPVKKLGVECIAVRGHDDTKEVIRALL